MREHAHDDNIVIPRAILLGALAVVLFSLVAVFVGTATRQGLVLTPEARAVEERLLRFETMPDGRLVIGDPVSGQMVALLSVGQDGFIKGVLRGLTRGRAVSRLDEGTDVANTFLLTRWDDGRISLADPVSGQRFDLNSFGKDNVRAFAQLLASREETR